MAVPGGEQLFEPDLPAPEQDRRVGLAIVAVVLLAGGILRLWLGLRLDDVYWSDETYKSLEQAHRLVFGYGIVPWEFVEGANNWAWPAALAVILKFASLVGLSEPAQYIGLARVFLAAAGVATAYGSFRLARAYGTSTFAASSAAALFALIAPAIYSRPDPSARRLPPCPWCSAWPSPSSLGHAPGRSVPALPSSAWPRCSGSSMPTSPPPSWPSSSPGATVVAP